MIDWTTVFATLVIAQAIRLVEIVGEWWFVDRKGGRHGKSKDK